jgi:hypothetical protein
MVQFLLIAGRFGENRSQCRLFPYRRHTSKKKASPMMKIASLVVSTILVATPALAISRHNSASMNCAKAQSLIDREGAVILRYPSPRVRGLTLYNRYVSDTGQCSSNEYAKRATVPTSDRNNCPVYACERRPERDDCFPFRAGCFGQ